VLIVNQGVNHVAKTGFATSVVMQLLCFFVLFSASHIAISAPKKVLLHEWQASDESSVIVVDHSLWQQVLDQYVVERNQQTYVQYALLKQTQLKQSENSVQSSMLDRYLASLATVNPLILSRQEQQAYWINLYNAATLQLMANHYPVSSITKVGGGFFGFGPWNNNILKVNNRSLSLNDIEHGILRPIYDDPRIHYAVNCASLSCPNLLATAFTANSTEQLLEQAARDYINHPRGSAIEGQHVTLSKIYDWYKEDFGGSTEGVLAHIRQYAHSGLIMKLDGLQSPVVEYVYDWQLNDWPMQRK
jgi:hypothetical protein